MRTPQEAVRRWQMRVGYHAQLIRIGYSVDEATTLLGGKIACGTCGAPSQVPGAPCRYCNQQVRHREARSL